MQGPHLAIGGVAKATGVKVTTIRFYEQAGLMRAPPRSTGDRRLYDETDVARLRFIRHARDLGFEMADVRTLLSLADHPTSPCAEADAIARGHLRAVDAKIAALQSLRTELARMADCCDQDTAAHCRVLESLGR